MKNKPRSRPRRAAVRPGLVDTKDVPGDDHNDRQARSPLISSFPINTDAAMHSIQGSDRAFKGFQSELSRLTASFRKNITQFRSGAYDESALRNDYLNPLWRSFGWDVENIQGTAQSLREVQIESRVDVEGRKKRADYLFRTDGIERFVCEAKKPGDELSKRAAYQSQRYAFNLKLHVAALTNFEVIQLFVIGGIPTQDNPYPLVREWHYSEFNDKAEELWGLFGRANVASGALDRLVASLPKRSLRSNERQGWLITPERTRTVDSAFLNYVERQREELARDLVANNKNTEWTDDLLNECVQRIIDRILFVRICEDRDIDTGKTLVALLEIWQQAPVRCSFYSLLVSHFNSLDRAFNGALFRRGHASERIEVSDGYLAHLISDLSSDDSPYLFNTLPVEILGSVYERFISRVVQVRGKRVKAELKPDQRKGKACITRPAT